MYNTMPTPGLQMPPSPVTMPYGGMGGGGPLPSWVDPSAWSSPGPTSFTTQAPAGYQPPAGMTAAGIGYGQRLPGYEFAGGGGYMNPQGTGMGGGMGRFDRGGMGGRRGGMSGGKPWQGPGAAPNGMMGGSPFNPGGMQFIGESGGGYQTRPGGPQKMPIPGMQQPGQQGAFPPGIQAIFDQMMQSGQWSRYGGPQSMPVPGMQAQPQPMGRMPMNLGMLMGGGGMRGGG